MFDISPVQILIVLAVALLIFGPRRLPEMGRSVGRGIREFKGGITGATDEKSVAEEVRPPAQAPPPSD